MKLKDKLTTLNPKEDVYIGSKSAYFFIGTPEEFTKTQAELYIHWHRVYEDRLRNAKAKLELHKTLKPKPSKEPVTKLVWEHGESVRKELTYDEVLKSWEKKHTEIEKQIEHAQELLDGYKYFGSREIRHIYRNLHNDATIIIVEGEESARFWFKSEWERYQKTGKLYDNEDVEDTADDEDLDEDSED